MNDHESHRIFPGLGLLTFEKQDVALGGALPSL